MAGAVADPAAPSALLEADGELSAQRDAPVGGQAVIEGVMMRGVRNWAVAVRKPTAEQLDDDERSAEEGAKGEIQVTTYPLESALRRHRVLRLPIVRGIVALGGSLVIGFRALEIAANAQLPPEEHEGEERRGRRCDGRRGEGRAGDPARRVGGNDRARAGAGNRAVLPDCPSA